MNRYLSTPLILLLGAAALNAAAQDRGYGRERGDNEARNERAAAREAGQGRAASYGQVERGDKRGEVIAPSSYGQSPAPVVRDQRGANYGGRQDPGVSGFGVQANGRQDYRGNDRGYDRGRDNNVRHDNSRGRDNHSGNRGYNNAYGSQDYRRGLPRTDQRYDRRDNRHDGYRNDRHRNDRHRNDGYRHGNRGSIHWRTPQWRGSWNHGWSGHRYRAQARYYYPRGYARTSWSIGYRLPLVFLAANYFVDYGTYGLAAPPYGCRWLRVDGDLLLVEIDSGEIVDILYDFYY
ncbi:MAG: RcnB family protein [Pseudomarimonas sp.]